MKPKEPSQKKETHSRKRRKKSKANSPVSARDKHGGDCTQGGGVSESKQTSEQKEQKDYTYTFPYPYTSPPVMSFGAQVPFGVQQHGSLAQSQESQQMPYMNQPLSPTQIPGSQPMYNMPLPPPSTPPTWMSDLINDVKQINVSLQKLDKIEQAVNNISQKVNILETKVSTMDTTVNEVEQSCKFISAENDDRKKELQKAQSEIKTLKANCLSLEDKNVKLETKVVDLESRSMRENLLFYGIEEGGEHENCERLIKQVCVDKLQMPEAETMLIDRAHRIGIRKPNKTRPIVAKFHYYGQKEAVKSKSYDRSEQLKQANLGIGMQWPQQIRDARKALYPIMQKEKQNGKHVRMARDKLNIDGILYKPTAQQQQYIG